MSAARTATAALEPIERASRDELQALQLQRLQWTLRHAYDNVAHYRQAFDAKGVHPGDLKELADLTGTLEMEEADEADANTLNYVLEKWVSTQGRLNCCK